MVLITAIIFIVIVIIAAWSRKLNLPIITIALAVGLFFGSDVTNIIYFDNAVLAKRLADIALIFIIFAGGFGTKKEYLRPTIGITMTLATAGVLLTAVITALFFSGITGWPFMKALLLSAIISSTDATAVFSILRSRSITNRRLTSIAEIESAANDPMAIISTVFIIELIVGTGLGTGQTIALFTWQLLGGIALGIAVGLLGAFIFRKIHNIDAGYHYVLLIGLILLSFGLADTCRASGILSAFFAGYVLGNQKLPYRRVLTSFTDAMSFIANIALFVLLGLLAFPKQFYKIWALGLLVFAVISFIGRPVTVFLCTLFTRLSSKEKVFLSWCGLKGAVPIVLATYPVAAGLDPQHELFNIVFFAVTLSMFVQGNTIGALADRFKFSGKPVFKPMQTMELVSIKETDYELVEVYIDKDLYRGAATISRLQLPARAAITMVNRNDSVIAPRGSTKLLPGDVVSLLVDREKLESAVLRIFSGFTRIP